MCFRLTPRTDYFIVPQGNSLWTRKKIIFFLKWKYFNMRNFLLSNLYLNWTFKPCLFFFFEINSCFRQTFEKRKNSGHDLKNNITSKIILMSLFSQIYAMKEMLVWKYSQLYRIPRLKWSLYDSELSFKCVKKSFIRKINRF